LDRALSGSGREVKGEHVMDPRSGGAASGHGSAWVACRSAAEADALSTALLVMDTGEAEDFFRRRPDVWAMSVSDGGGLRIFNPGALDTEAGGRMDIE
jgi:thiamine biosynthesis lipoprotein